MWQVQKNWKAARCFWDGSKNSDGRSVCRVVIKDVDSDKVTISKIAVPLKTSTVMAAEVVGANVQIGTLDLVFGKTISVNTINQCIDDIIKFT